MRFHSQNLNERRVGEKTVKGSPIKAGRCWLYYGGKPDDHREAVVRFEWSLGLRFGAHVELDPEEHEITFNLAPIFGSFYLTFQRDRVTRWLLKVLPYTVKQYDGNEYRSYEKRETGFYMHDWSLFVFVWANRDSWSRSDRKWKQFSINFPDLILGRMKFERVEVLPPRETLIPLPEGQYPATVKLERCTWKRPRWRWWPFKRERTTYEFEIPDGIPFPGKGENSWDCGDDALHGCGYSAPDEAGAIAQVVATVLRNRLRYGGRDCMLTPWKEPPLERAARIASIRARRSAEELADKAQTSGNP